MSETFRVQASPLIFLHPRVGDASAIEFTRGRSFSSLSRTASRLLMAAIEPIESEALCNLGFGIDLLEAALGEGLLMRCDDPRMAIASAWEDNGWSRAAYLLFSQMNLPYAEEAHQPNSLDETVSARRLILGRYLSHSNYPPRFLTTGDEPIMLPRVDGKKAASWNTLFARRSIRSFSRQPVSVETLANFLWNSTTLVRVGEDSKQSKDDFFLLNSFYTWLVIFVAIQDVDGLDRGLFQYDPLRHELRPTGRNATDDELAAVIQNQKWIGGSGFCVFVGAQWDRYMWLYRHSRAYVNLLIQVGEFAQEMGGEMAANGLGGWMTPAVDEEGAQALFGMSDPQIELLFFQKVGPVRSGSSER